jgi:hypothetical protein
MLLPYALLVAACGSTSPAPPPPPRPEIAIDPTTCESTVETIATIDGTAATLVQAMAIAPDGTVYFAREDVHDQGGLFAIEPGGGTPRRISTFGFVKRMWTDGDSILIADFDKVYRVPRTGGDAVPIGAIPHGDASTGPLASTHAFDGAFVYLAAMTLLDDGHQKNDLWRIPKEGGAAELLFTSNDAQYDGLWNGEIVLDDASLYIGASGAAEQSYGVLMKLPKTGGTPEILRANAFDPAVKALALFGTDLYAPSYGKVTRWPLDPSLAPTTIEHSGVLERVVADASGAYAAFFTSDPADQKSFRTREAFARIPNGVEHTTSLGCTAGSDGPGWYIEALYLDATHLYALASDDDHSVDARRYAIFRMPR